MLADIETELHAMADRIGVRRRWYQGDHHDVSRGCRDLGARHGHHAGPSALDWLYLAAVLDLATRKVVGWAMRDHMRVELTLSALIMAVQRQRPAPGLLQHSDRGSQYAAEAYVAQLTAIGAVPSMSRKGCCYDNAPMESFFHTLKVELVHGQRWAIRDQARRDLFSYIETYYNRARMHSAHGYLSPEQAEQRMAS
jgi:transposase InsO family protein